MKKYFILLLFCLCFTGAISGQTPQEIQEKAAGSIVALRNVDLLGYGFFVDDDLILTNYQVISGARTGAARASVTGGGVSFDITGYVSDDSKNNLVLLKSEGATAPALRLRETPVGENEEVYVFESENDTAIRAIPGTYSEKKDYASFQLIKISTPVAAQTAGLPVLDKNGFVIGITVPSPGRDTAISYAIPLEKIKKLIADKRDYSKNLSDIISTEVKIREEVAPKSQVVIQHLNQGNSRLAVKDYKGALERFNAAVKLAPNDPDAYVFRGQARYMLMEYKDAYNDFDKAIEIQPDYAEAYNLRGITKAELGDQDGACQDWNKAYQLGFNHAFQLLKRYCNLEKLK
jgi:tetratricopeptide (TPR) repeat protein